MPRNETKLLYKTHGNAQPGGKPRVYFTCHPADFETYFEKVCADLFAAHDCAVYYTEDMAGELPADTRETDLDRMNLFVIPVTTRLLVDGNRAMDEDFAFAKEKHIPVLPLMMQPGLGPIYSKEDRFGKLQYLDPFNTDSTAIPYEEKLKKYLEAVLVSDETVKRVRAAFDAYIFLSYRKKDRAFANTLMRLIHNHPRCRDIAVWYDEFLTPGESFNENIERALRDSRMFTLLVTPNLLEETNGKPNFVMGTEYPAARDAGMDILPAEMQSTDRALLAEKFAGLPTPVKTEDEAAFTAALTEAVCRFAKDENDNDPAHNYLIGLAYLDGIDVETNRERGLELITSAAEADLPEAMVKLRKMYENGTSVALDYRKMLYWAQRLVEYCERTYGEESKQTLTALHNLASSFTNNGEYTKALGLNEKCYTLRCKILGEEHSDTLRSLSNLAMIYGKLGDYKKALELKEKCHNLQRKSLGEEHSDTLTSLNNLASTYDDLGDHKKALEINEKCYTLRCKVLGEEHPKTLTTLNNLAQNYSNLGKYNIALDLSIKCYTLVSNVLGEKHPNSLTALNNLSLAYDNLGNYKKSLELNKKCYSLRCTVLGEEHPSTLTTLSNLAIIYYKLGDYKNALETNKKCYTLRCRVLGEEHPNTLTALNNLALTYDNLGNYKKALEINEKCYTQRCKALGEEHPDTLLSLSRLASIHGYLGNYQKEADLGEKCYTLRCKVLGKEHPDTLISLNNLALTYDNLGNYKKELETNEKCYTLRCKVLGEEHPDTLISLNNLASTYVELGEYEKAQKLNDKCFALCCNVLGEEHPTTLTLLGNLAYICGQLGDVERSCKLYDRCYVSRKKVLGEMHTTTLNTAICLAQACLDVGNREKSVEIAEVLKNNIDNLRPNTRKKAEELFAALQNGQPAQVPDSNESKDPPTSFTDKLKRFFRKKN